MPIPVTPPPIQLPPSNPQASDLQFNNNNDNNFNPYNVQYVTPNSSNLEQDQSQSSVGTGVSNVDNSPKFVDSGSQAYIQNNTGYGENGYIYLEGVGKKTVTTLEVSAYYNRADIGSNLGNNAHTNNYGAQVRAVIPFGGKAGKSFDELAEAKKKSVALEQTKQIANIDDQIVARCAKMANSGVTIDIDNASPVLRNIANQCRGMVVVSNTETSQPVNNDLEDLRRENEILRQQMQQLIKQNQIRQVHN